MVSQLANTRSWPPVTLARVGACVRTESTNALPSTWGRRELIDRACPPRWPGAAARVAGGLAAAVA